MKDDVLKGYKIGLTYNKSTLYSDLMEKGTVIEDLYVTTMR